MDRDPTKQLEGFFLEFTRPEIEEVREELERRGYEPDGTGIKDFLMEGLFEDDDEETVSPSDEIIRKATKFVTENPATIKFGLHAVMGLVGKMGKGRRH
jgi:hypothetical protein